MGEHVGHTNQRKLPTPLVTSTEHLNTQSDHKEQCTQQAMC